MWRIETKWRYKTKVYELNHENPTIDVLCKWCYPVRMVKINVEKEFLKFKCCKIKPQLISEGYSGTTIMSCFRIIDVKREEFIKEISKLI